MAAVSSAPARIAAAVLAAALVTSIAHAQERHDRRDSERFHTPHWAFDDRYHHNHYYPVPGYAVTVLPAGHISVTFRGGHFYFHSGVWFEPRGHGFVVVRPPAGIVVPVLPPGYTTVWIAGAPYYYANDVYYMGSPGGYTVAQPPMVAGAAPVEAPPPAAPASPPAPAPQSAAAPGGTPPGMWYYCESAKAYYPYVTECSENWRPVPAAPPPAR